MLVIPIKSEELGYLSANIPHRSLLRPVEICGNVPWRHDFDDVWMGRARSAYVRHQANSTYVR